jgi:PrtD family type I secretion system ABC transporter
LTEPARHSISGLLRSPALSQALSGRRGLVLTIFGLSATLNVLMLSGAMFMLLVYDEVLPSRSTPSLIALLFIVVIAYLFQAIIEHCRDRIMQHVGEAFEKSLSDRVFSEVLKAELRSSPANQTTQPVRDLDQVRSFLVGSGPTAIFDLPWVFLFLGLLCVFHYFLGIVSLIGALILVLLTLTADRTTRNHIEAATRSSNERNAYVEACRRNAEVIYALGMNQRSTQGWVSLSDAHLQVHDDVSGKIGLMRTLSKTFRMFLQSLILACGAWLVIQDQASGGVIIASSILSSRALAPIELAIGNWRGFVAAQQAWNRLAVMLEAAPVQSLRTSLPAPRHGVRAESLAAIAPGTQHVLFRDINLSLKAGETLAIVGASGSGKSSLARALVGVLQPARGAVRLDGASLDQWDPDQIGEHIGYLPQDIELFDGSIAQNIARFDSQVDSAEIVSAARAAGVHDLIVGLANGYDTVIGPNGRNLSAGQRQRIALARAMFRDPFLIVLDEPNSNLDAQGDAALNHAIATAKNRGAVVILVAHRPSALFEIDILLWLDNGIAKAIGPKAEILSRLSAAPAQSVKPPKADVLAATNAS